MIKTEPMPAMERSDTELVADSLAGNREAFRQIVERYQTLICSVAYNATGNLSRSEDVAQETFISAWTDLPSLRDPAKLRAWLCGIVRHRVHRSFRAEEREPVDRAGSLEHAEDSPTLEASPSEQAINREEEAILWRSLARIPELYREPLILFYREHQSIEGVAAALALSEDAVKQRLSRGRKLLQEEVQAFVEKTLRRTAPGQAFSGAVFAALPAMGSTGGVTAVGTKGAVAAKSSLLPALLPFLGFFAGFLGQWTVLRASTPKTEPRAKFLKLIFVWACLLGPAVLCDTSVRWLGRHFGWSDYARFSANAAMWWLYCAVLATWLIRTFQRQLAVVRQREALPRPTDPTLTRTQSMLAAAGMNLMLFSWLIRVTWLEHDWTATAVVTGTMLGMWAWSLSHGTKTGATAVVAAYRHMTLCCAAALAVIVFRADVWCASAYDVSVAEVHVLLPLWLVPALALALVMWVGLVLYVTTPKVRLEP